MEILSISSLYASGCAGTAARCLWMGEFRLGSGRKKILEPRTNKGPVASPAVASAGGFGLEPRPRDRSPEPMSSGSDGCPSEGRSRLRYGSGGPRKARHRGRLLKNRHPRRAQADRLAEAGYPCVARRPTVREHRVNLQMTANSACCHFALTSSSVPVGISQRPSKISPRGSVS